MAQIRFANNVSTQLTKPVAADDSTITVRSLSDGLVWPDISATGDYFLIVIDDISMATWEILKCTKVEISGNATTLTVERGIEGTTPSKFNAGSVVENRLTAGTLDMFSDRFPAVVEIDRGGTGATTIEEARTNLGVPSEAKFTSEVARLDQKIIDNIPPSATTSVRGTTILSNAIDSVSEAMAATPKAVKTAYDDLNSKILSVPDVDAKTIIEKDGKVIAKDIAIDGDPTDLASKRGQLGSNFKLPEDVDLNTVFTPGFYGVRGVTAQNTPTKSWGYLQVMNGFASSTSSCTQLWINVGTIADLAIYIRTYTANTWTPWNKTILSTNIATTSNSGIVKPDGKTTIASSDGTITTKDVAIKGSSADLASKRGQLGECASVSSDITDFNDLVNSGAYFVEGAKMQNAPTGVTGLCTVYSTGADEYILQIFFRTFEGTDAWFRTSHGGGTWYPWRKLVHFDMVATSSTPGIVKPGTGTSVAGDGALSVDTASTSKKGIVQLSSSVASTSETTAATSKAVKAAYDKAVAASTAIDIVGEYKIAHLTSIPGYLLCNGAAVSRTTYKDLYAKIGTKFGIGDGKTTFNLPDFRNRVLWGSNENLGTILAAGLPNITGTISGGGNMAFYSGSGAFRITGSREWWASGNRHVNADMSFDASRSNSIYGEASTVQPPAITVNIFIKY